MSGKLTTHAWTGALLAATMSVEALAARSAPMQPTGKWNVDFGDAHCIAMRNYGTEAVPIMLALKPSPVGDVMQVSLVRQSVDQEINQYPGLLYIGALPAIKVSILGHPATGGKSRVNTINLPLAKYAPMRSATMVRMSSVGEVNFSFALSQMAPVARALDQCVTGLKSLWHIGDQAKGLRTRARVLKPVHNYFSTDDYPQIALSEGAQGMVAMMILIDLTGKVASCTVTQTSGFASLDARSCAVLTSRAMFAPAVGIDGKSARDSATLRVNWALPRN